MNPKSPKEILLNLAAACEDRRQALEGRRCGEFHTPSKNINYINREDNLRDLREVFYNAAVALSDPTQ